jgi:hypothetical protein
MESLQLNQKGQLTVGVPFSQAQVAKFPALSRGLAVIEGVVYLDITWLHGVLLTNSRSQAAQIVLSHQQLVNGYLMKQGGVSMISMTGLCILLNHLALANAERARGYRHSLWVLSCIVARSQVVQEADELRAKTQKLELRQAIDKVKKEHKHCQVSGQLFVTGTGMQRHAHHLLGKSENPQMAAEVKNLVLLEGKVHDAYHAWLNQHQKVVHPHTLGEFALEKGYDGPYIQRMRKARYGPFAPKNQRVISQVA